MHTIVGNAMKVKAENLDVMGGMMNIGNTQIDVLRY